MWGSSVCTYIAEIIIHSFTKVVNGQFLKSFVLINHTFSDLQFNIKLTQDRNIPNLV